MSISIVQAVPAVFPQGVGTTATANVTNVQAGNALITATFGRALSSSTPAYGVSDGLSYASLANAVQYQAGTDFAVADISALFNVSAGTHTVVTTAKNSTSAYGWSTTLEIAGLSGAVDVYATSASANGTVTSGTTTPVSGPNEISIAVLGYISSGTGALSVTAGYVPAYSQANGSLATVKGGVYTLAPVAGAQNCAFTAGGVPYVGAIVTLKASGVITVKPHLFGLLGVGS